MKTQPPSGPPSRTHPDPGRRPYPRGLRWLLPLPLLFIVAWSIWTEVTQYRQLETQTTQLARHAATAYANLIAARLDTQVNELQFVAQALLGPQTDPVAPDPRTIETLRRFMALHPSFHALQLQSAEGGSLLWSTRRPGQALGAIDARFTPLPFEQDCALGVVQQTAGGAVLPLRCAVRNAAGSPRWYVIAPYRLADLLQNPLPDMPWTLALMDSRNGTVAGRWENGQVSIQGGPGTGAAVRLAVGAYPFTIAASWPGTLVRDAYVRGGRTRWGQELGGLLLLVAAYYGMLRLARRHDRSAQHLQHLAEFNAMLVRANQIASSARDEQTLLQSICAAAVEQAHLQLAFIARPDESGRFQILAAAGATGYLEDLHISSDPAIPEGRGSAGRAWRANQAMYNASFERTPFLAPWQARARRFGFGANATLMIERAGSPWAILSVYHAKENVFDAGLQALLEELARDVSHGLDRIDLWQTEWRLNEQLKRQALHDPLTDLPNRLALQQRLPETIARARRNGTQFAVGMIDLDDFKPVNDLWGHEAGDRLLQELARRLQARLRETDLLARLWGDEFVVVLDSIDERQAAQSLGGALARLHEAVETPFAVAPGQQAEVGMSLGLALYPGDATEVDALLRLADAALYQAKTHKHDRVRWWHLGALGASVPQGPETEGSIDPYGPDAAELLSRAQDYFETVAAAFVEAFYARLAQEPQAHAVLSRLNDAEMQRLKARQAEHLRAVLNPAAQREDILRRATRLGEVHILVGVDSALLVQSLALYRRMLSQHLNQAALPARSRYRLLLVAECRLQDDIQAELQAQSDTMGKYFGVLAAPRPPPGALWPDISLAQLDALAQLPGVLDLAVFRPDALGVFQIEAMAGAQSAAIRVITLDPRYQPNLDTHSPLGRALVSRAWRGAEVLSAPAYALDEQFSAWHEVLAPLGVRSALAIPVLDASGHPMAVVRLFGAYPNQFESLWMRQFARGLQQRLDELWQRCSTATPAAVLPREIAQTYRARLFAGGLTMHLQPIVDLRNGQVVKVEALARLRLEDGSLVAPASFLPLLGDADLDHLFRLGLAEALAQFARWRAKGWQAEISVNLPPAALLDPDCPRWIHAALQHSGVPAACLTVEIIEPHGPDLSAQDAAIAKLLALGVKLSMDDVGSGYSNLQRLAELPVEDIKIDQHLLCRLRSDPLRTLALIAAIIQMGQDFSQNVIVEGLEDLGMVEAVAVLGAPYGQGHGLAHPMPAEDLATWRQAFRLPLTPGTLHSYLGALAYHWRFVHGGGRATPSPAADPLAHFIADRLPADSPAACWHAQTQQGPDAQVASQALMNWLADQVRQEAADSPPPNNAGALAIAPEGAEKP